MRTGKATAVLILSLIGLSGCGTQRMYSGESRPSEAVSILETPGFTSGWAFIEIDGKRVNPFQSHSVEVLPGNHLVHIWLQYRHMGPVIHALAPAMSATFGSSYYCAKFEAITEAGEEYVIQQLDNKIVLATNDGRVAGEISEFNPLPFINVMTSTPSDCSKPS